MTLYQYLSWNLLNASSLILGSSSSCNTRIDWNKLMLSDRVELIGSDGASLLLTPLRFLQWHGWLCKLKIIRNFLFFWLKLKFLPDIFHDTSSHHIQYTMLVILWIWMSSCMHKLVSQIFHCLTKNHESVILIYHQQDIHAHQLIEFFYWHHCEHNYLIFN